MSRSRFVSPGTRLGESESKATKRPSPLIQGRKLKLVLGPGEPEAEVRDAVMLVVDAPPRDAPTSGAARGTSSRRAPTIRPRAREPPGRPRPGVRSFPSLLLVPRSVRSERL